MAGGLLNLIAYGNKNVILNGNPSKTFFKTTYAKYTNFGLQKFRIDVHGPRVLQESTPTFFEFTIPRYADLLMDTYFVITIPHIWSPIYVHNVLHGLIQPYEFKWIENLGAQLIKKVRFTVAGKVLQEFTGQYLHNMVQRDFSAAKKDLFNNMTGNTKQFNDPANYGGCKGNYPSFVTINNNSSRGGEPSIRGGKLYVPFNIWFVLSSKLAFPLLCLQKNELKIQIECRSIRELFVIRDLNYYIDTFWDICGNPTSGGSVFNPDISYSKPPYISTQNIVDPKYQLYLFLTQNTPSIIDLATGNYKLVFDPTQQSNWYADIHLLSTYAFLDQEEIRVFISKSSKVFN